MDIGALVERLVSLGVSIKDASDVIAKAFAAGANSAPSRGRKSNGVQMTMPDLATLPSAKGTRIPKDFKPDIDFALSLGIPKRKAQLDAENFKDYWAGVPGKDGIKSDWPATWRNRCRSVAERIGAIAPAQPTNQTQVDPRKMTPAEWAPILAIYEKTSNWNSAYGPEPGSKGSYAPQQRAML